MSLKMPLNGRKRSKVYVRFVYCMFFAAERLQHSPKYGVFCRAEKTMEIRVFTTK